MNKYIVIKKWSVIYTDPLKLTSGQEVLIDINRKEENPDWKGWVWCETSDNRGWVPEQILNVTHTTDKHSKATVLENYSAEELNADPGELVIGDKIINGWLWCRKEGTEESGWLPIDNLSELN
jgi:hypothetical protein